MMTLLGRRHQSPGGAGEWMHCSQQSSRVRPRSAPSGWLEGPSCSRSARPRTREPRLTPCPGHLPQHFKASNSRFVPPVSGGSLDREGAESGVTRSVELEEPQHPPQVPWMVPRGRRKARPGPESHTARGTASGCLLCSPKPSRNRQASPAQGSAGSTWAAGKCDIHTSILEYGRELTKTGTSAQEQKEKNRKRP